MRTHDIHPHTPRRMRRRTVRGLVVAAVLATTTSTALALAPTTQAVDSQGSSAAAAKAVAAAKPVHPLVAKPIVIGHRGAPGYRPEHTQGSYELASELGADFVECDIVSTKDHVLVCRHENDITGTTDVADHPEFANLKTTKVVDGRSITGWFTEDFTWAQLQTLRAKERLPDVRPANTAYNGVWSIPSFDQYLDIIAAESKKLGRPIGVYPETKHPTYFDSIGLSLEEPTLQTLKEHGLARATHRVFLQSFEISNLKELNRKTDLPLIQLIDASGGPYDQTAAGHPVSYQQMVTKKGLKAISRYADGVGPNKDLVIPRDANGFLAQPTDLVRNAHLYKLLVHIFTLRNENQFMAKDFWIGTDPNAHGDAIAEDKAFLDAGIDGFFTDYADTGVAARDQWLAGS